MQAAFLVGAAVGRRVGGDGFQKLLAGRGVEPACELHAVDAHERDFGQTEHAAAGLEVAAERPAPVAKHEVAVDVVVGDDPAHGDDLHAARALPPARAPCAIIAFAGMVISSVGGCERRDGCAKVLGQTQCQPANISCRLPRTAATVFDESRPSLLRRRSLSTVRS